MKSIERILAIAGRPGLFELVAQSKTGIVVQSLDDGKRVSVSARQQVHALNEIAMYTYEGEKPLREIYEAMGESLKGEATISHKSSEKEIEAVFSEYLPDYDEDRVYLSDKRKFVNWYNALVKYGFFGAEDETETTSDAAVEDAADDAEPNSEAPATEATQDNA